MSVTLAQNSLVNNAFLETIKAQDGKIFHLEYHQRRYESVLSSYSVKEFESLQSFLSPPKKGLFRCRVLYTLTNIEVTYHPYSQREIKILKLVYDDNIAYDKKFANRDEINELFALREEADDVLIIKNAKVTDTSIANIAFFDGEKWLTPKEPLLKGTTRERLLKEHKIFEADISVKDLKTFTKVALLNAMIDFDIISTYNTKALYC